VIADSHGLRACRIARAALWRVSPFHGTAEAPDYSYFVALLGGKPPNTRGSLRLGAACSLSAPFP